MHVTIFSIYQLSSMTMLVVASRLRGALTHFTQTWRRTLSQVAITSRETIKPSSPTPNHLKTYTLSVFDQICPRVFVPLLFFYPRRNPADFSISMKLSLLKQSLSKTLTQYYPFSGRIKDRVSIDCNDEGAVVLEAIVKCELSEFLKNPKIEAMNSLFPDDLAWNYSDTNVLLFVQISQFDCGGISIGVCLSHKIADAATIGTFIKDWGIMASSSISNQEVSPQLDAVASTFPQGDFPVLPESVMEKGDCVTRRFVFDASKIGSLKAIAAATNKVQNPSRIEVVTALTYKCCISAFRARNPDSPNPSVLIQAVNMRKRVVPPLPENFVGNLVWFFPLQTSMEESELVLHSLVGRMKEELLRFCNTYAKNFRGKKWSSNFAACVEEALNLFGNTNQEMYRCSALSGRSLYRVDFGWGKPIWVTAGSCTIKNTFILIDTRESDGIEAYVTLEEEDMAIFECNEELLSFAAVNPSAIHPDHSNLIDQ